MKPVAFRLVFISLCFVLNIMEIKYLPKIIQTHKLA